MGKKNKSAEPENFRAFEVSAGAGLRDAHELVARWAEEAIAAAGEYQWYEASKLPTTPAGQAIFDADPALARRCLMAAAAQTVFHDQEGKRAGNRSDNRVNEPAHRHHHGRRRQISSIPAALLRRNLNWPADELGRYCEIICRPDDFEAYSYPWGLLVKTLERFASDHRPFAEPLADALRTLTQSLRAASRDKAVLKAAGEIDNLIAAPTAPDQTASASAADAAPTPKSAPAGRPAVLTVLKRHLNLLPADEVAVEDLRPDHFMLRADSPYAAEHRVLGELLQSIVANRQHWQYDLNDHEPGKAILDLDQEANGRMLLAAAERDVATALRPGHSGSNVGEAVRAIARRPWTVDRDGLFDYVLYLGWVPSHRVKLDFAIDEAERWAKESPLTEGERHALSLLRLAKAQEPRAKSGSPVVDRLTKLIGDDLSMFLVPDEHWSVLANADVHAAPPPRRAAWVALLEHWMTATAARPTAKWLKATAALVDRIGKAEVAVKVLAWFAKMPAGRLVPPPPRWPGDDRAGDVVHDDNASVLRGMAWTLPTLEAKPDDAARVLAAVAASAYRKIPGVGPRAVKVGNAAIYALSEMRSESAVGQLATLKSRVKFGTAQKEIEKAFNVAAEALGLPRDQIEELGVPTYGMDAVGLRRETFGDAVAELRVDGKDATLTWTSNGKPVKSVPAKVKAEFKDELKELQGAAKDVGAMLTAQSARLDAMFLSQARWPLATWQQRYLDHPLVGTLARRLIWASGDAAFAWHDGRLVDVKGRPVDLSADAEVTLWHPIGRPVDDVLAWRAWLAEREVVQPFKQAHREVYLLTDAEVRTGTYSNRFAAHVIRQHQFNALCAARGWKNKLRLMVDDEYPPAARHLPQWNLRAEFWIEGIGDDYGTDTTDSGSYLRLATDQVRFYRSAAAPNSAHAGGGAYTTHAEGAGRDDVNLPLPLDQIPPLVLSEVLRDVDLFVGVASVGNDPTWQDGGPGGRFQTYWQSYSFGDLTETAKTRRAVLESLLPRLTKLKGRWALGEKFLTVCGELRTYKIHLGSSNILMEPNDQYLCIVPDRSSKAGPELKLPFEGDATLSVILSKAFLLAADAAIKDPTITRQIGGA